MDAQDMFGQSEPNSTGSLPDNNTVPPVNSVDSLGSTTPTPPASPMPGQPINPMPSAPAPSFAPQAPAPQPAPMPTTTPNTTGFAPLPTDVGAPAQPSVVFSNPVPPVAAKKFGFKVSKKVLIIAGSSILGVALLAAVGFFGWRFYIGSSNARILNAAAKNIIEAKNMSVDFRTGVSGVSVAGKLYSDKDQDLKLTLDTELFPLELIYIKKDDKGYMKTPDYSSMYGSSSQKSTVAEYMEYDNVQKAISKYGLSEMGVDNLNPNKNYFTSTNVEFMKREEDEKVGGRDLYKYSFNPSDEAKAEAVKKVNEALQKYNADMGVEKAETTAEFWVGKSDFRLYSVKGETKYTYIYKVTDYQACSYPSYSSQNYEANLNRYETCLKDTPKKEMKENITLQWSLDFNYDFNEDIKLPEGAKITDTVDLMNVNESTDSRTINTASKNNLQRVQATLNNVLSKSGPLQSLFRLNKIDLN